MKPMLFMEGGLLSVDTGLFWWVLITFALFIFVISKFAWNPILTALSERENNIKDSLSAAEKALAQAHEVTEKNEKALRDAEVEAQSIRRKAMEQAEAFRADRLEKAKVEAEKLIDEAKKAIEQEKQLAISQLRNEVASLAIEAATRILHHEIDAAKNKKLVDEFIKEVHSN